MRITLRERAYWWLGAVMISTTCQFGAQAQQKYTEQGFRPITPSAYNFFKYTDNKVNQYTGVPEISVPIHTLKLDGKSFPLAFTYHAGGIRVDEEASWIGLGWDLRLPTIVQTINDEDDFQINTIHQNGTISRIRPDYPPANSLVYTFPSEPLVTYTPVYPTSGIKPAARAQNICAVATNYYFPYNTNLNRIPDMFEPDITTHNDSEPDIFTVSLFDETLTFVRNFDNGDLEILNNPGYSVSRPSNITEEWLIVDPEGYRYTFGQKQVGFSKIDDHNFFGQNTANFPTPSTVIWSLTSVVSPRGKSITVAYASMSNDHECNRRTEKYQRRASSVSSGYVPHTRMVGNSVPSATYLGGGNGMPQYVYHSDCQVTERRKYPMYISSPDVTITFDVATSRLDAADSPQLQAVHIQGYLNGLTGQDRHFVLHQGYFQATTANTAYQPSIGTADDNPLLRLKLNSITEENVGKYLFTYDAELLPSRYSYARDHWGFYNGHSTNNTLVPNSDEVVQGPAITRPFANSTNNHGARLQYARAGTLIGITYPTGGTTKYVYELNTFEGYYCWTANYSNRNNVDCTGNGLRIKEIRSYAGNGKLALAEQYEYTGGKAMLPLQFYSVWKYNNVFIEIAFTKPTVNSNIDSYYFDEIDPSGQYSPAPAGAGTGVGYTRVKRQQTGQANGATITYYTNNADISGLNDPGIADVSPAMNGAMNLSLPAYSHPDNRKTGATDSIIQLAADGRRLQKIAYDYESVNSSIHYGARVLGSVLYYYPVVISDIEWYTWSRNLIGFYPIYAKRLLKKKETTTVYSQGGVPARNSTTYTYDNLDRVTATTKSGRLLQETSTYTYPVQVYSPYTMDPQEQALLNQHRLSEVLSYTYRRGPITAPATAQPLYSYAKQYQAHATGPVVSQVTVQESGDGVSTHSFTRNYSNFDNLGRPQRAFRSNGPVTTYLWHTSQEQLLAEVKSGTASLIAYTSFGPEGNGGWSYTVPGNFAGGITGSSHYEFQYELLSPSLPPGNYTVSFWAKNGTPVYQLTGATASDQLTTRMFPVRADGWKQYQLTLRITTSGVRLRFPAGGANATVWLDEARLHPVGAQMTTFNESSLQGLNSVSDPAGRLTTYEYDAGNRLQRTRDEQQRILVEQQYQFANP